ncbi:MAG: M43 family zinc metalloprotease [Ignavibacteria bacterium]
MKTKNLFFYSAFFLLLCVLLFILALNSTVTGFTFLSDDIVNQFAVKDSLKCTTMELHDKHLKNDPAYERRLQDLELLTKKYIANRKPSDTAIVKVPVVVHIVYNTPYQNISNARIQSQIDALNRDYRRLNWDTANAPVPYKYLGADTRIEFVLAKRDPWGNPSIGITRTQTSVSMFTNEAIKFTAQGGHDIWDRDKYLNFWIGNIQYYGAYTQLPGYYPETDGAVMHYILFGTVGTTLSENSKGRVATHEVGHWFNLQHLWGLTNCGTDYVDDTPTQFAANFHCPVFPVITCNNGPYGDMFMNYMDGTSDDCKNMFTIGQRDRMNAALYNYRSGLITSEGRIPVSGLPIAHFRSDKMSVNFGQSINFFDESGGIPTNWQWTFEGGIPSSSNQKNPVVNYPNSGIYSVRLKVSNSFGTDSVTYTNYLKIVGANMSVFNVVHPPSITTIHTNASDTSKLVFKWNKSGTHPSINYKWKVRKAATPDEYSYFSDSNGFDTLLTVRKSFLDSLAVSINPNADSLFCVWNATSFNGSDSLKSQNELFFIIKRNTVGINNLSSATPDRFMLYPNYPNPFNQSSIIRFQCAKPGETSIKIYDLNGKEVMALVNNFLKPGTYQVRFDASQLSSGVYFYKMTTEYFSDTKRMVILK